MSQTVVPAAPAGAPPDGSPNAPVTATGTLSARLASASAAVQHSLAGTPGRLRVMAGLAVLATLIVAFGGGAALRERSSALSDASSTAQHLVLLQGVQTALVTADADAANSFLAFGLEPRDQRVDYIDSIKRASRDLAVAAKASSADAATLGAANAALTTYTSYVASARANNLQGWPVGASYLQAATTLLREDVLVPLAARSTADQRAIDDAYARAGRASWWLAVVVVVGLGVMIWVQVELARRTHRYLSLPVATATVGLVIGLVIAGAAMALAQSRANDVKDGALARTTALSQSRVWAFTAKSVESQTLISRGSSTKDDPAWTSPFNKAVSSLPSGNTDAARALQDYRDRHQRIHTLDFTQGKWQDARRLAISTTADSANAAFDTYDERTGTKTAAATTTKTDGALLTEERATKSGLGSAGDLLLPAGILILLLGLMASVGAWWGFTLRLDEYR
jgi:hypothetical protein